MGKLFPLDGGRWLGGDVVDYAVHAANLVDDLVADLRQEFVGEVYPVGGHAVGGDDGAQGHAVLVRALVAHHAYTLHGQQHHAGLPYLVVPA